MRLDTINILCLHRALNNYYVDSRQLVSEVKCIHFSPCRTVESRVKVCTTLNIMTEMVIDKYLGLPLGWCDKSNCFPHLIDRVC